MRIEEKSLNTDLFAKSPHENPVPPPMVVSQGDNLPVPVERLKQSKAPEPPDPAGTGKLSALVEIIGAIDTHHLSPRQMANLSLDLYAAGALSFEDYAELAFQPELHPDFNQTIGALTGEKANPDRPRDFVRLWQDRAAFQRRHNNERPDLIDQSERIAGVLRQVATSTNRSIKKSFRI